MTDSLPLLDTLTSSDVISATEVRYVIENVSKTRQKTTPLQFEFELKNLTDVTELCVYCKNEKLNKVLLIGKCFGEYRSDKGKVAEMWPLWKSSFNVKHEIESGFVYFSTKNNNTK